MLKTQEDMNTIVMWCTSAQVEVHAIVGRQLQWIPASFAPNINQWYKNSWCPGTPLYLFYKFDEKAWKTQNLANSFAKQHEMPAQQIVWVFLDMSELSTSFLYRRGKF